MFCGFRVLNILQLGTPKAHKHKHFMGGPYNKDPTIWGAIFGSPIFRNPRFEAVAQRPSP